MDEPFVDASVIIPATYVGTVMDLARDRRGVYVRTDTRPRTA